MTREETINFLRRKIEKNPKSILFARLADFYLKQKRIKEALDLCTRGIENNPDYITGNYILAKIYLTMGDHEKAEKQFKKVISHDRYFMSAHKHLGDMMAKIGWENKAINHYKDILKLDPLEEEATQMLETFSLDESSDENDFIEEVLSSDQEIDIHETEEFDGKEEIDSKEIDQELRKVFDEDSAAEQKSRNSIELEEVTSQDKTTSEKSETNKEESLEFELPDDLDNTESFSSQLSADMQEPKSESEIPESEHDTASQDKEADSWSLPGDMAEEITLENEKPDNLEDLDIAEPSQAEQKSKQETDETESFSHTALTEETDEKKKASPAETTESIEEPKDIPESEAESEPEEMQTSSLKKEREEDLLQEEPPQPLDDKQTPEIPSSPSEQKTSPRDKSDQEEESLLEEPAKSTENSPAEKEQPMEPIPEDEETEKTQPKSELTKEDSTKKEEKDRKDKAEKQDNLVTPTLGEIYSAQGQYSKALDVYKKLLQKNPDNKDYKKKIQELENKV